MSYELMLQKAVELHQNGALNEAEKLEFSLLFRRLSTCRLKLFPGAKEVLQFFHNHQIPVTVVSNKDRELLEDELPRLFDPLLFDTIVCGHEAPRDKPAPQQLQFAVQKYVGASDITPDNVWMIGDSLMDSECGLAAHAQPILIGKPIWHNVTEVSYKIWHYDNFMQMYQDLVREND